MSNLTNEAILQQLFEYALEMFGDEEVAQKWAENEFRRMYA